MEAFADTQSRHRHAPPAAHHGALRVGIPAGPDSAFAARHALAALRGELDPELLQKLRLLVSELVTNSVRHSGIERGSRIDVHVAVLEGAVRMTVTDAGRGFVPWPPEDYMHVPGGGGLLLVDQLADRWGVVDEEGSRVWLEIGLRAP